MPLLWTISPIFCVEYVFVSERGMAIDEELHARSSIELEPIRDGIVGPKSPRSTVVVFLSFVSPSILMYLAMSVVSSDDGRTGHQSGLFL